MDLNAVSGSQTGGSWTDAFLSPVQALSAAKAGDEIWVARGTYKPTSGTDRSAYFYLRDGFSLYGGFSGVETTRDQRDWGANPTILSGDIGRPGDNSDNSAHVLRGFGTVVVDGFTVTAGNANAGSSYFENVGGGITWGGMVSNPSATLTLQNVAFIGNSAASAGAAGFFIAPARMINCVIANNTVSGTGISGVGAAVDTQSQLYLINSAIVRPAILWRVTLPLPLWFVRGRT